jgi:hypothetical protein
VDLPKSLVAASITCCCVCYFKDTHHSEDAPPHFYIVLPVSEKMALICTIITSQISKREKYYDRTNPKNKEYLVKVDKSSLPFLDKPSVIDCNQTHLIYTSELESRVDNKYGFKVEMRKVSATLEKNVKAAIKSSTVVKKFIKDLL